MTSVGRPDSINASLRTAAFKTKGTAWIFRALRVFYKEVSKFEMKVLREQNDPWDFCRYENPIESIDRKEFWVFCDISRKKDKGI